jgi:hypothetical protein
MILSVVTLAVASLKSNGWYKTKGNYISVHLQTTHNYFIKGIDAK